MTFFETWSPVSWSVFAIALVATFGLMIGNLKVRGIGLGSAGVLFAGLIASHFGMHIDETVLEFAKEFGLILFVFTIGIQLGPSIIGQWKDNGLKLNALAAMIVALGVLLTLFFTWEFGIDGDAGVGLFSGATTNTPSLGAAQQTLEELIPDDYSLGKVLALAYAVAYPGAILGIIASILILKRVFSINIKDEEADLHSKFKKVEPIERRNLIVENSNINQISLLNIPGLKETGVRISRIWSQYDELVHPVTKDTLISKGDVILVVGTKAALDSFQIIVGNESDKDLMKAKGEVSYSRVLVTNKKIIGKPLQEIALDHLWNVSVTRVIRSGVEMTANGRTRLHFGDLVQIVGGDVESATRRLGNSSQELNQTQFIPFFVGLALGVFVGMFPISLPGFPVPIRLGLAGGPLIVAIILSLIGNLGTLVWYIPNTANRAMRELGIVMFLACIGLHAGGDFIETVFTPSGVKWLVAGIFITTIPILVTGFYARKYLKMNFITISGLLAGSMTDPPALAFAGSLSESEGASVSYAAVYPLAMTLRILSAQILVLLLCS